ncbi:hypothetical protein Aspvir_001959 [Aspergillus viridinutans]|uniref:Uncharacterized protein n=1 Tax=Aspergillus viridinutans TaxID=75553 RepID=A0A9P3F5E7_ASPVI|nr:uncharacterized protein Aspvir_001959 [Aspergillus viridinutans]GIK06312.1 hypothetical protein Aspvir_001959 [Aspergillus viridinutans]
MPPFKEKCKPKRNTHYVNGIGAQTTEAKYIEPESESLSSQGTVVENVDAAAPESCDDLEFHGSTNAFPAESSGKMMTIFAWTSLVCLDSLDLVDVIPEPDEKSGLVEGLFMHNGYLVPVFVPSQYAEQRKHHVTHRSKARQVETRLKETARDRCPRIQPPLVPGTGCLSLPPSPTTTTTPTEATDTAYSSKVINCGNLKAFAAWARASP